MGNSPSVEDTAQKSKAAKDALTALADDMLKRKPALEQTFQENITKSLKEAHITDAITTTENWQPKFDFLSEFDTGPLAKIITAALQVGFGTATGVAPAQVAAYKDLVIAVSEAARMKSSVNLAESYTMVRIANGFICFLFATSNSVQDSNMWGKEAVSCTYIAYRIVKSIQETQNATDFDATLIDSSTYLKLKTLQAGLIDTISAKDVDGDPPGTLSFESYVKKDADYEKTLKLLKQRLDAHGKTVQPQPAHTENVQRSMDVLKSTKASVYNKIAPKINARVAERYYD